MKRMVLLALMLAVLCAGCTLENGTPEPGSETEQSVSQEEVSESGPTETELEEAARLEILMKEVLCYECSHGGVRMNMGSRIHRLGFRGGLSGPDQQPGGAGGGTERPDPDNI